MKFKAEHTFEERKAESERVRNKYPDRVPGNTIHLTPFPDEITRFLSLCLV